MSITTDNGIEELKYIVARTVAHLGAGLSEERIRGTAFLISRRLALTCAHCLHGKLGRESLVTSVTLHFNEWPVEERVMLGRVVAEPDWECDVALLELDREAPSHVRLFRLAQNARIDMEWNSQAYPTVLQNDVIQRLSGSVLSSTGSHTDTPHRKVMALQCNQIKQKYDFIHGTSGGPVLVDGVIVGILSNQLIKKGESDVYAVPDRIPLFGMIYAQSLGSIREFLARRGPEVIVQSRVPNSAETMLSSIYRHEIADIICFYSKAFVGREEEWQTIASFVATESPGYLLVEAPSGFGKSSLLAELIHRYEANAWDTSSIPKLLYFFIKQTGKRNTSAAFLHALVEQLQRIVKKPVEIPTDFRSLTSVFTDLWQCAVSQACEAQPLLLLVDGLDEMANEECPIAQLLPSYLGSYSHIVVSSRPNPRPLQQVDAEHPFRQANTITLLKFSTYEVEALLRKFDATEELIRKVAARVVAVTKGEPLFARFICREITSKGLVALKKIEDNPPKDVRDYFEQELKKLDTVSDQTTWDILGLLSVVLGPISSEELADILETPKRKIAKAIVPINRYLLGDERFELMHRQLRRAVENQFSAKELENYRNRIVTWCQKYQHLNWPDDTPTYVVIQYAKHLEQKSEKEAIYSLISRRWMDLHVARTYSYTSFMNDLHIAFEAARSETPPNVLQEVRVCLVHGKLRSIADSFPFLALKALAGVGRAAQAKSLASFLFRKQLPEYGAMGGLNPKIGAYISIGEALLDRGERRDAKEVFLIALSQLAAIDDNDQVRDYIGQLARPLIELGEFKSLKLLTGTIADENARSGMLHDLGVILARAGRLSHALEVAHEVAVENKDLAYADIARVVPKTIALSEAMKVARTIHSPVLKAWALSGISSQLAECNEAPQAEVLSDEAYSILGSDRETEPWVLRELALTNVKLGLCDKALTMATHLSDDCLKAHVQIEAALKMCEHGTNTAANSMVSRILKDPKYWVDEEIIGEQQQQYWELFYSIGRVVTRIGELGQHLDEVSQRLLDQGYGFEDAFILGAISELIRISDFAQAINLVDKLHFYFGRVGEIDRIFSQAVGGGNFEHAVELLAALLRKHSYPESYISISHMLCQAEPKQMAKQTLEWLLDKFESDLITTGYADSYPPDPRLAAAIAWLMVLGGRNDRAETLADAAISAATVTSQFHSQLNTGYRLWPLVEFLTKELPVESRQSIFEAWPDLFFLSTDFVTDWLRTWLELGNKDRANRIVRHMLEFAKMSNSDSHRHEAVMCLSEIGDLDAAFAIAETITDTQYQVWSYEHLAEEFIERGNREGAIEAAHRCLESSTNERYGARDAAVMALGIAGNIDEALVTSESILDEDCKTRALTKLASWLSKKQSPGAMRVSQVAANCLKQRSGGTELTTIDKPARDNIIDLIKKGEVIKALEDAQTIDAAIEKADALCVIAMWFARRDDTERASELIVEIVGLLEAETVKPLNSHAIKIISQIVTLCAEKHITGLKPKLLDVVHDILAQAEKGTDADAKIESILCEDASRIALCLARLGVTTTAVAMLQRALDEARRVDGISAVDQVYQVLEMAIPLIKEVYGNETVEHIARMIGEVENWWISR